MIMTHTIIIFPTLYVKKHAIIVSNNPEKYSLAKCNNTSNIILFIFYAANYTSLVPAIEHKHAVVFSDTFYTILQGKLT